MSALLFFSPPSYGGGGPQGRRGKAAVDELADSRSEIFEYRLCCFPPPPRMTGHLPRVTGEDDLWVGSS
jgi:hypothetical protein